MERWPMPPWVGQNCWPEVGQINWPLTPGSQGQGIGSVLLGDAKTQRPRLQLTVYKENAPSIQFYERHGFTVAGEQTDEHTGHAELLMEFSRQPNTGS